MFLPASSSLPLLPPPFTSILSTHYPSSPANTHDQYSNNQPSQRRSNLHQSNPSSLRNPNSLHSLLVDESVIASRKAAISTYGYSWLRPAGVAKTMLGRREEEAEREELERQMREQEEMEAEIERGEQLARQGRLRGEQLLEGEGEGEGEGAGAEGVGQRNLDDDIPDADEGLPTQQENGGEAQEDAGDVDLDDEIPDADADDADNSLLEDDSNVEGETGITDEVELTNIRETDTLPRLAPTTTRPAPGTQNRGALPSPTVTQQTTPQARQAIHQAYLRRRELEQQQAEQEALAHAMLDEDEQALAERDLDAEIPDEDLDENEIGIQAPDLDDDIPEADDDGIGEGEWQHTDTELEEDESAVAMLMEDDEGGDVSMEMSVIDGGGGGGGRRSVAGNVLATPASLEGSSMLHTPPTTGDVGSGARGWLNRTSIPGRGGAGNLFARITGSGRGGGSGSGSPQAPATRLQPQTEGTSVQEQGQGQGQGQGLQQVRRRSGRHGLRRENRSVRDSLD
ncbi:hypothetical protein EPUS_06306 [Endocarpon pusillum Z07020]|uniref:Apc15p protein-domain-containing protein n=1 Tax=Endocarpon pusillum (strain Z07020 / HMAS-L-300199) TaxID=1263415 RepID=U1GX50_ENDPU|nr:uncharacterized protein EPUS_06306 [Endocarpon pusillum Z07020]ERF77088.1 hypothetical protein EPUS_06306 [Endocarpon pusillum Z07020]